MVEQHIATLGLGSNLGDRLSHLTDAITALARLGEILARSSIYATEPVDYAPQPEFLNQVVRMRTRYAPFDLLQSCHQIELDMGRVRLVPKGPRTIDLDLLLYDREIIHETRLGSELIIPHPRLHLRRFVLQPLADLMPDYQHPELGKSIVELLEMVEDAARVTRWNAPSETLPGNPS